MTFPRRGAFCSARGRGTRPARRVAISRWCIAPQRSTLRLTAEVDIGSAILRMGGVQRGQPRIVDLSYRPGDGLIAAFLDQALMFQVASRFGRADLLRRIRDSTIQGVHALVGRQALLAVFDDDGGHVAVESGGAGGPGP